MNSLWGPSGVTTSTQPESRNVQRPERFRSLPISRHYSTLNISNTFEVLHATIPLSIDVGGTTRRTTEMPQLNISDSLNADRSRSSRFGRINVLIAVPIAVLAAIVVGVAGTAGVAAIAHAAGVSNSFQPLKIGSYAAFIIFGAVAGCVGWQLVRTRAGDPGKVLHRLVPLVVLVSFVPDVVLGITGAGHATWGGVLALLCAHVVVATVVVTSFSLVLPSAAPASK